MVLQNDVGYWKPNLRISKLKLPDAPLLEGVKKEFDVVLKSVGSPTEQSGNSRSNNRACFGISNDGLGVDQT